jgi:hypothetical protein
MKISFYYYRSKASYSWSHSHASAQLIPSYHITYTTIGCVCVLCYPPITTFRMLGKSSKVEAFLIRMLVLR